MKISRTASLVAFAPAVLFCTPALAQEAPPITQATVGVKLWDASWQSYLPGRYSGIDASGRPTVGEVLDSVEGNRKTNVLPQFAVRYGNVIASASYGRFTSDFSAATTPVLTPSGATVISARTDHFTRRESELTLGYFVTPELVLTIGYKDATEDRTTSVAVAPQPAPLLRNTARGFLAGAYGTFPVQGGLRLYAQAGYGPARIKTSFADAGTTPIDASGRYMIGEIGFSYLLFSSNNGIKAAIASVGYRSQVVKTYSEDTVLHRPRDLRDTRDGFVLSMNLAL